MTIDNPAWKEWVETVRASVAARLPDIVRARAEGWHQTGPGEYRCRSPLRAATSATGFSVSAAKASWYDFGLGEGGDALSFLRRMHGLSFRDALDLAAREGSVHTWDEFKRARGMAQTDPVSLLDAWNASEQTHRVREIMTSIAELMHAALPGEVRAYLRAHYQLSDETIDEERIGWAFAGAFDLALEVLPFTREELLLTGFFHERSTGEVVVAQAHRIVFPYWKDGLVVYSIGRHYLGHARAEDVTLPEWDAGKYKKHLTQTARHTYVSHTITNEALWGEDLVTRLKPEDRRRTTLFMAEGITDAMILAQAGYDVISPVTTSISAKQIERTRLLARSFAELVIVNDNDEGADGSRPGERGALRTARLLWGEIIVKIATIPKPAGVAKVDVNEFVGGMRREGLDEAALRARFDEEVVRPALPFPEYFVTSIDADTSATDLERLLVELGGYACTLTPMQRHDLVARVHKRFPKMPKGPAKLAIERGAREEAARRERMRTGAATPEDAASGPKRDPSAAARLRSVVFDELGTYERQLMDGTRERISNFSLVATRRIVSEEPFIQDRLELRAIAQNGEPLVESWIPEPKVWASKRAFVAALPSLRMQFFGSDEEVQAIQELLVVTGVAQLPSLRATTIIGYHEVGGEPRFALPAGTLAPSGWMDVPDLRFVSPGGSTLQARLPREQTDIALGEAIARDVLAELAGLHAPEAMGLLVPWFFACAFKPRFLTKLKGFPVLDVSATAGSGKTASVAHLLWPLASGAMPGELGSASSTPFALLRDLSSSNAIPLPLDEYKPNEMRKDQVDLAGRMVKRAWSGDVETRGRADQTVAIYPISTPLAVIGESGLVDDHAASERCLHVNLSPVWLRAHSEAQRAFARVTAADLTAAGVAYLRWTLGADFEAMLAAASAETDAWIAAAGRAASMPPRVRVVLITVAFGLRAVEAWAAHVRAPRVGFDLPAALDAALRGTFEVDDKGGVSMTQLDSFDRWVVDASRMATLGLIREGVDYRWTHEHHVFLHLGNVEAARETWYRSRGSHFMSPGARALRRLAAEKTAVEGGYVVCSNARAWLDDDRHGRGVTVVPDKIPDAFGADGFPLATRAAGWGGARAGAGRPAEEDAQEASLPWATAGRRSGRGGPS
jgi:DNA primase